MLLTLDSWIDVGPTLINPCCVCTLYYYIRYRIGGTGGEQMHSQTLLPWVHRSTCVCTFDYVCAQKLLKNACNVHVCGTFDCNFAHFLAYAFYLLMMLSSKISEVAYSAIDIIIILKMKIERTQKNLLVQEGLKFWSNVHMRAMCVQRNF